MLSLVFVLDDAKFHGADISNPTLGNPAMGGTEYSFVSLAHELSTRGLAKVTLLHRNRSNHYPKTFTVVKVEDYPAGLGEVLARVAPPDCVLVRGHDSLPSARLLESLPHDLPVVAWTHNHLKSATLSYLARSQSVKRVVYVGREQCALAAGSACQAKSTYIVPGSYFAPRSPGSKDSRAVYLGSLVPQKGFHRLARLWPQIRQACPTAALDVIGSSPADDASSSRGALGIASPAYEKLILRYLRNEPAKWGVVFHGKMGIDKYDVMSRALVGLPNPTGFTECCPASVVEMSGCGAAVVALRQWGMCDTVLDRETGYLCEDDREYVARVISLFADPGTAQSMGTAGQRFVRENFSYDLVCQQWARLLHDVVVAAAPNYASPAIVGRYPLHRLRAASSRLRSPRLHAAVSFVDRVRGVFLQRY